MIDRSKYNDKIVIQKRYEITTSELTMELVPVSKIHQIELERQYTSKGNWYALPSTVKYSKDANRKETREIFENVINELDIPEFYPNFKVREVNMLESRL